ncbi:unnamed protein product [Aphanomyces euteiches]
MSFARKKSFLKISVPVASSAMFALDGRVKSQIASNVAKSSAPVATEFGVSLSMDGKFDCEPVHAVH